MLPWAQSFAYSRFDAAVAASTGFFAPSPQARSGASATAGTSHPSERSSAVRERVWRGGVRDMVGEFMRFAPGRLLRDGPAGYSRPAPHLHPPSPSLGRRDSRGSRAPTRSARRRAAPRDNMPPEAIQPFPWRSLEAIPGSSVFALRDVRRWAERQGRPGAFARALTDLIGADVELLVRRATPRAAGPAVAGGVGLLLGSERAIEGEAGSSGAALLEVEAAMALAVVSRVIRRPLPTVIDRGAERAAVGSGALAGAFAAIVVAAARSAHAVENPRVVAAGSAEELEARFVRDGRERIALSLTVLVGDEAYAARLVVAHDDARFAPSPDWTLRALASLGATPLSIPLVACASTATLAEIAALRQGDAWIPGTWTLGVGVGAGQA